MRGPGQYSGSSWRGVPSVSGGLSRGGVRAGGGGGECSDATNARGLRKTHGPAVGAIYTRSAVGQFNLCVKRRTLSKRGGPPKSGAPFALS